ncbi:extracellular solute-binding protein [Paenibacillus sp. Marseille-Q4541]|uniref:extracellular solute-binding protein n=1 Tax=Paenibacillus sp. Marseille-Q4541 TaxID=2831522 RepID=UPI001BAD17F2|nr:extracellular solute-binding protein [Paenibacillus sp. Marseille-Q4541]
MKREFVKLIALTICGSLLLSACGGIKSSSEESGTSGRPSISWLNILHTASPPTETVLKKIEDATDVNLKFSWIPDASKEERLNTSLASDTLADIVSITIMDNSTVRNALKGGVFWDVAPYLDEFPNLAAINQDMRNSASIEGKLYGVPLQKQVARNGAVIRKDWLDKLGLSVPKTTDELMAVAKAFTDEDPDGNGVKDTTGFVDRSDLVYGAFKTLSSYFGTPNVWSVSEDGHVSPEFESEGYIKTMDFMKELYNKGYINQEFAVTAKTDQQQNFAQGKAGIYIGALFDSKNLLNLAKGIQDDMDLVMVNDITSTGNESDRAIWSASNGIGGLLAFPKSEVKDEAELKQVLKFVNDLMSEEVYTLLTFGIEGVHYEVDQNKAVTIMNTDLWKQEVQPFASSRPKEFGYDIHDADPLKKESDRLIQENEKYAVLNPMYSLESPTFSSQGSELQKTITDATYKYILGKIDLNGFQQAVQSWRKAGGDKIIAEYQAAYNEVHSK